ncbi:Organic cation transporter [Operophtera brumata]|uniref:Organic cation transporter n=1 Tax=Operophtera brumata TaxID=104452 RepID=A0A0L7LVB7_OPEBR|nr:Organic cation transporter [Operophtera brumata]
MSLTNRVDLPWLSVMVYMVSKLMCSFYFGITYMYTSELFPTYTRNSMHALCSSLGRIGSIIAPQTPLLMVYWPGLPSIVFGSVSFVAGAITFLAPDSADTSLPDTVRQAEAVGTKIKGIDNIAMTQDIQTIDKQNGVPKDSKLGLDNLAMMQEIEGKGRIKNS